MHNHASGVIRRWVTNLGTDDLNRSGAMNCARSPAMGWAYWLAWLAAARRAECSAEPTRVADGLTDARS
jgi:hypothetical protein